MSSKFLTKNTATNNNSQNVVSLHPFRDGSNLTPLRQAEAYWCGLRTGAEVPSRSQIDPRGLENILEYAFILERIAPGEVRFRLAGRHINDLAGMEVRGMPMSTFFSPSGRIHLSAALEHVFDAPAVVELTLRGASRIGRPALEARMMLLPLQTDTGQISRALGVLVANEVKPSKKGLRLSVVDTVLRPVSGFHHVVTPQTASEIAAPKAPPVSHLRLV